MRKTDLLGTIAVIATAVLPRAALAQDTIQVFAIEEAELGDALRAFAQLTGREVLADDALVTGKTSRAVRGRYTTRQALDILLRETGLRVTLVDGAFVLERVVEPEAADEVVVTGTRIRGAMPVGAPVTIIDRQEIDRSGRGTVESLLQTLPANFGGGANPQTAGSSLRGDAPLNSAGGASVNLRGLGAGSTLVLFDGNRPALGGLGGTFADISLIPQLAIERIEVLSDGASSIYGSDAVAGVVNFRFRSRFAGAESWVRTATADGSFGEYQLGQIAGRTWRDGGLVIAYEYNDRGRLAGSARRFSTEDLRPFGGADLRSPYSAPGNIIAADGTNYAIPAGQDGRAVHPGDLIAGAINRTDQRDAIDLLPRQHSHALYAAIDHSLSAEISAYARMLWARRTIDSQRFNQTPSPVAVPTSNAFYVDPTGSNAPVYVQYDFSRDLGRQFSRGFAAGWMGSGGIRASVGSWRVEANAGFGRQVEETTGYNQVNLFRLSQALADASPERAFNIFGPGGGNQRILDSIRGSSSTHVRYSVWTAAARTDGPLFNWPGGAVRVAAGYEHRSEALRYASLIDLYAATPESIGAPGLPAQRDIDAIYAELLVPIASEKMSWFPGTLDLSLAGRAEWYEGLGGTKNPKVGLAWRPLTGVTLRGGYGRSFRAPTFLDLAGAANSLSGTLRIADPNAPTGASNALVLFGYDPEIGPERADTWTAGVDLRDVVVRGLTLSASYFSIAYRDRIASAEADYAAFLARRDVYGGLVTEAPAADMVASYYAAPRFSNLLGIPASQVEKILDARTRNLSRVTVRGIDVDARLRQQFSGGTLRVGIAGTRILAYNEQITDRAAPIAAVATTGHPVKLRLRGEVGWTRGGFDLGAFANYTAGYRNTLVTPAERVSSWLTVDAQLSYALPRATPLANARIALAATNLFDRDPPYAAYVTPFTALGYDPEQANPVGRTIALQLVLGW
jgi:outer membrane receptor protein involved in Fe transport